MIEESEQAQLELITVANAPIIQSGVGITPSGSCVRSSSGTLAVGALVEACGLEMRQAPLAWREPMCTTPRSSHQIDPSAVDGFSR